MASLWLWVGSGNCWPLNVCFMWYHVDKGCFLLKKMFAELKAFSLVFAQALCAHTEH